MPTLYNVIKAGKGEGMQLMSNLEVKFVKNAH